jgi:Spy/CpxP family protein refolding chaperone
MTHGRRDSYGCVQNFFQKVGETNATTARHIQHLTDNTMNNTSKILLLSLGAALAVVPAVRAQDQKPDAPSQERREKMRDRAEQMAKELGLTEDQQAKFKDLFKQERDQMKAVHDDTTLSQDQKREKGQEIRKNFEGQRRALMTPEQQKKADEMRAKMMVLLLRRTNFHTTQGCIVCVQWRRGLGVGRGALFSGSKEARQQGALSFWTKPGVARTLRADEQTAETGWNAASGRVRSSSGGRAPPSFSFQ